MKTQYFTATSIDGFIADEEHSLEWLFQFGQIESMENDYPRFLEQTGAAAMGSATYEWITKQEDLLEHPERWPYEIPVWVFSSRNLPAVDGANIHFVSGDVVPVHSEMAEAAKDKNIWIVGGGELAGQFYDKGLLDELILTVSPVMLGSGAPLLPRNITSPPLKLTDVQKHGEVFAVLTYIVEKRT